MKDEIYIIKYRYGDYDEFYERIIFATESKTKAIAYVERFNQILEKWKTFYSQFEIEDCEAMWIKEEYKEEYIDRYFQRGHRLQEIDKCFFESIELR